MSREMAMLLSRHLKSKQTPRIKKMRFKLDAHRPKHAIERILVPWMSKFEWQTIKQQIFSSEIQDKISALNRLTVWKSRCCGRIPLGIEVTDALLRAYVRDCKCQNSQEAQILHGDLVMMYSSAIIRFVNLVTEIGQTGTKNTPVNILAKKVDIPEWLVDLRHEASHSNFPALSTLQAGFHLAMSWIEENYWNAEAARMSDIGTNDALDKFTTKNKLNLNKNSPLKHKWELASEQIEWQNYPLGVLPSQLQEIPFLDLTLPVSVDSLYSHQPAVLRGCIVDTSDTETVMEEENHDNAVDFDLPNLEERYLQPLDYHRKFFKNDTRPDGRNLTKVRPFGINIGSISTADGSSVIKLGHTTVVCGIKTVLLNEKPRDDKLCSLITISVDLSPICSSLFRSGPTNEQTQIANQFLIDVLNNSKCVSIADLHIPGIKYCHRLYCDIQCLNYDGNFLDAATTALISALKTVRLPNVKIDSQTGEINEIEQGKKLLKLVNHPVSTTFIIFDEDIILIDPTSDEEAVASATLTITITEGNKISNLYKPGIK
uniref:Uncharacterized protein n=1 Tax=Strigamia maritima TaxID=126957 RepID=T1JLX9_STRMM